MDYQTKKISGSQLEITGEIPAGDFDNYCKKAFKKISEKAEIPGFRKGQVPENILKERTGEHTILEKAAEEAMAETWPKILKEQVNKDIEIIGKPQISITKIAKGNPLGFKIVVSILPKIEIGEYKEAAQEIMSKKTEISVEDKEVQDVLEYLRKSKAAKDKEGKETLPDLNDDFAKSLGNVQTLEELKNNIKENLKLEKEIKERDKKRIETLDKIAASSKLDVPDTLVEAEKEKMVHEMKSGIENMGMNWNDYLNHLKKTAEDLKKGWQKDALRRVQHGLILREIANKENIQVTEEEVKQRTEQMLKGMPEDEAKNIDQTRLKNYTYGVIRNEKTFQFLEKA